MALLFLDPVGTRNLARNSNECCKNVIQDSFWNSIVFHSAISLWRPTSGFRKEQNKTNKIKLRIPVIVSELPLIGSVSHACMWATLVLLGILSRRRRLAIFNTKSRRILCVFGVIVIGSVDCSCRSSSTSLVCKLAVINFSPSVRPEPEK